MNKPAHLAEIWPLVIDKVADHLSRAGAPVVTAYEMGAQVFLALHSAGVRPGREAFNQVLRHLQAIKLISPHKDFADGAVFSLFGQPNPDVRAIACTVDPFAYITHLSAMEFHGLTDRFPKILYLCSPSFREWRRHAEHRMAHDLGEAVRAYRGARFPLPGKPAFRRIAGTVVQVLDRSKQGAFKMIKGSPLRVATVGRTFLDMLREPQDCGGMQHVLDIYKASAPRYLTLIVDEVDRNGTGIDKVRAGYVLTDLCGLAHPTIKDWERFAQRGGSRKLDPNAEYASDFSARWKLSLNVPSLQSGSGQHG